MRCEYHVGVVEQRMVLRRFGIEDIESHAAELPRLKRREGCVKINQPAATAVDQNRSGPYTIQK
jgi:hypothetical protein